MFWGKTNKVMADLTLLAEICQKGVALFSLSLKRYIETKNSEEFLIAYEEVCSYEKSADQQVFLITQQLYSNFLLPDSREDLARLVHQCDSIMDMAQKSLKLIITRKINLDFENIGELFELLEITEKCVAQTVKALTLIMGPKQTDTVRQLTQEVGTLETLSDTYQDKIITSLFSTKNKTVEMLLHTQLIETIGEISDACENTAVILSIMNVKRIA